MCPDAGLVPRMSEGIDTKTWPNINAFFKDVNARAFRFAEYGLRSREDAMDAVQDAMLKMLAYGDRPANEWTPLFWRILRTRVIDMQRRRKFRLSWMLGGVEEDSSVAWADTSADPARAHDYAEAGTYSVTVTVTDPESRTVTLSAACAGPTAIVAGNVRPAVRKRRRIRPILRRVVVVRICMPSGCSFSNT